MLGLIRDEDTELAKLVEKRRARTGIRLLWHRMLESKLSVAGLVIIAVFVFCAIFGPLLAPHDPLAQTIADRLQGPTLNHPLGTDQFGRDILSRLLYGARVSLLVGVVTVFIAVAIGSPLGLIAGYYRGKIDTIIMRILDAVISFPALILALGITAALGPGVGTAFIAISIVMTPVFARLVRGSVLSVREREYVEAARAIGTRDMRIMFRHILPNVIEPIIVVGSLMIGACIIIEAGLSFLGVGVQPPNPSWGSMLGDGYLYLAISYWPAVSSGFAIALAVLGFNLVGDGLRDALDPRLRRAAGIQ
jgi:peptide/nickel transport system permease protein